MARRGRRPSVAPKRGSEWMIALWIAACSLVVAIGMIVHGRFTWGEGEDGTLITRQQSPVVFWAGVAFPATVGLGTIAFLVRIERNYRDASKAARENEVPGEERAAPD